MLLEPASVAGFVQLAKAVRTSDADAHTARHAQADGHAVVLLHAGSSPLPDERPGRDHCQLGGEEHRSRHDHSCHVDAKSIVQIALHEDRFRRQRTLVVLGPVLETELVRDLDRLYQE